MHEEFDVGVEKNINAIGVMMEEERDIDLFERYRNNELSDAELRDFEARLAYDNEFKHEFDTYQSVEEGVKNHFRNQLKYRLQEIDKAMDGASKKKPMVRLIAWTTSVAAAIVIGVFIFQHFATSSPIQLAEQYWPHEAGLPVKMSAKGKYDDAMNAFKLEEWDNAAKVLKDMQSDTAYYFLGVIAYENQNYHRAAEYFWQVENNSRYYSEAQFRLALVSIINEDLDLTRLILQAQIEHQTEFAAASKEILEKLR